MDIISEFEYSLDPDARLAVDAARRFASENRQALAARTRDRLWSGDLIRAASRCGLAGLEVLPL